jgi:hypothetical protein
MHAAVVHRLTAPDAEPAVHGIDFRLLGGLDLLGKGSHLGIDAALIEEHVDHGDSLLVVRDHNLGEQHIGVIEVARRRRDAS